MNPAANALIAAMRAEGEATKNEALTRYAKLLLESDPPLIQIHVPPEGCALTSAEYEQVWTKAEDVDVSHQAQFHSHSVWTNKEAPSTSRAAFGGSKQYVPPTDFQKVTQDALRKRQAREEEEARLINGDSPEALYFIADGRNSGDSVLLAAMPEGARMRVCGVTYRVGENCTLYEEDD